MSLLLNKKEQTYEILKDRILKEYYSMGDPLNIRQISEELGISNSPVREALNMLEKEGLVIILPNNVPRVVSLEAEDMFEVMQMIFFWMTSSYRYCVHTRKQEEMCLRMEKVLRSQEEAMREKDRYRYSHDSIYFDRCIIEATGNRRLLMQFDHIYPLFYLCTLYIHKSEQDYEACLCQHKEILEAAREGRNEDVIDSLTQHYYRSDWGGEIAR